MKKIILTVVLVGLAPALSLSAQEGKQLFWQNAGLEAELALAKSSSAYFIIDEAKAVIRFKAKGVILREWKIERMRCQPMTWSVFSVTLQKKEALVIPQRKHIDPKKAEEIGSYELESLESKDMPSEYILTLEDGSRIRILSVKEKFLALLSHWEISLQQALYEGAKYIWWAAFKPKIRMIHIRLIDEAEAKTLCWSLFNGMKGLILFKTI